jgi:hypothetical protein
MDENMKKILLPVLLFFSLAISYGQESYVSLKFDNIRFSELIDTLEKLIPVKFYYSDKWVGNLSLSVNEQNVPFSKFIGSTFTRLGFSYFITGDNRIILSKGFTVKTKFGEEYLEYLKRSFVGKDTSMYYQSPVKTESNISEESRIFKIGNQSSGNTGSTAVLSGTLRNNSNGDYITGAIVYIGKLRLGATTNNAGLYSITLPKGQYQIEYRMMGMKTTRRNVILYSDGVLDVGLSDDNYMIKEVIITGNRDNTKEVRTGIERINMKMLKQIPMGLGEVDIVKSSLLLPGVQTAGEASEGFNVRGGSTDQNLVFLNNAPVINTSHLFGFFSAFNPDLVSEVSLYKSAMPAKYGGRLSSVMVINPAQGNPEKVKLSGGISPIAGRILLEGPLPDKKSTFILGVRTTYSDWLLGLLNDYKIRRSSAGFYDLQGSVRHQFNDNNSVTLSGYLSNDRFNYYSESAFGYGNFASTVKWDHTFNSSLIAGFYAIISNYKYKVDTYDNPANYNSLKYKLDQKILRADFQYTALEKHRIEFGLDAIAYSLYPGIRTPFGNLSEISYKELEREKAIEPSVYISDEFEITPLLSVSGGLRGTLFTSLGPKTEFRYYNNSERSVENIIDTIRYARGRIVNVYHGLEFRLSSRLTITSQSSVKISAQRVFQYIHMISNTTSISPTDIWKLSDSYLRPERSDQVSVGYYHNYNNKVYETSVEAYYKKLTGIYDYKGGAILIMNEHLETDILNSEGKAYGVEVMVKKQSGSLTGWVSYTYSRSFLRTSGEYASEKINGGEYFPADFDKPHDIKFVANAKLSRRLNITSNFNYSSGRPITYPAAFFNYNNTANVYYSLRNSYRMPDYIRLDLAVTLNGNLKSRKLNHSSLTFSVYNVMGRKNPYSIFFRNENGTIKGYQLSIFGQPIIMLTYNFRVFGNASGDF